MCATPNEPKAARSVIVGGGIAGLTAAIALSPHFEEVCIVERDPYPDTPTVRPHTPQGSHVHILLAKGLAILSELIPQFPGWLDEMGLREGDLTRDVRLRYGGQWLPRVDSGIPIRPCTRPVVEHLLLRAARARPNVRIVDGARAVGLVGRDAIVGVRVRDAQDREDTLCSDWTVDAGGRASRLLHWLASLEGVIEETVDAGVTYSSCTFRPPTHADEWMFVGNLPRFPDEPRATALMRVQDGNWLAAVVGYRGTPPPRSIPDMVDAICHHLSAPYSEQLRAARPLTKLTHFKKTANRRRRLGRIKQWPDGLAVVGDAACLFNPRYGQGMTVATLGARTMAVELQRHWQRHETLAGLAARFQRALDRALDVPWHMALMEDRLWAGAPERRLGLLERASRGLSHRILRTVFADIDTYIGFMRVAHMMDSPTRLLTMKNIISLATIARSPTPSR